MSGNVKLGLVYVEDQRYSVQAVRANPERFSALIGARADDKHGVCACRPEAKLRIKICALNDRPYFARWPNEGRSHDVGCIFHEDEIDRAVRRSAAEAAIKERDDGLFSIKPSFSMSVLVEAPVGGRPPKQTVETPAPRPGRRSTRLLNVLRFLWTQAGLDRCAPGESRTYGEIRNRFLAQADQCLVGKQLLSSITYFPEPYATARVEDLRRDEAAFGQWLATIQGGRKPVGLVVGLMKGYSFDAYGRVRVKLRHWGELVIEAERFDRLKDAFRSEFAALESGHGNASVAIIATVHVPQSKVNVIEASLMLLSNRYVPVDSGYELAVANRLAEELRAFRKPLAIEPGAGGMLPDFVLEDTTPEVVMEVFGMKTAAYLERKDEKLKAYRKAGTRLWQWDAAAGHPMPPFPSDDA